MGLGVILGGMVVALLAAGVLYQRAGLARQRRQFAPGQLIDVGGHRLHATCRGTGSPIVLFESGIAASSLSWSLVAPAATPQRIRLLRGGQQLSRVGAMLAHLGVVRACLALLTGGAPAAPRNFVKIFGPTAAHTLERLVGEVRSFRRTFIRRCGAIWCQPKCFHAMAGHMSVLERGDPLISITNVTPRRDIPVVVLSGGNQPPEQVAAHRLMADASDRGRHVIAARSAHWIQFDQPELIVEAIRDIIDGR